MDLTRGNSCAVSTGALTPIPERGGKDWPPVVVGCVHQTGLNLMRDFVRKGVRAVGIDYVREHEGFRSIYGESRFCPNPDEDPSGWLVFMRALARSLGARPGLHFRGGRFCVGTGAPRGGFARGFYLFR